MLEAIVGIIFIIMFCYVFACEMYAPLGIWTYFKGKSIIDHEKQFWKNLRKEK